MKPSEPMDVRTHVKKHATVQTLQQRSIGFRVYGFAFRLRTLTTNANPIMAPNTNPPMTSAVLCLLSMMRLMPMPHPKQICGPRL